MTQERFFNLCLVAAAAATLGVVQWTPPPPIPQELAQAHLAADLCPGGDARWTPDGSLTCAPRRGRGYVRVVLTPASAQVRLAQMQEGR